MKKITKPSCAWTAGNKKVSLLAAGIFLSLCAFAAEPVWPSDFAEKLESFPYRYIMLTMDRQNFPGMPKPNWTYGGMYLYGANPSSVGGKDAVRDNNRK